MGKLKDNRVQNRKEILGYTNNGVWFGDEQKDQYRFEKILVYLTRMRPGTM